MKYICGTRRVDSQTTIVTCQGEMDSLAVEELHQAVDPLLADAVSHLVFDLGTVEYISSSILSFLMASQAKAQEKGGKVSLVGASDLVKQVFEMAALDELFSFYGTMTEAGVVETKPAQVKSKGKAMRKEKAAASIEEGLGEEEAVTPSIQVREPAKGSGPASSRRPSAEVHKISPAPLRSSWRDYGAWIGIAAVASISVIVSLYFYLTR